MTNQDESIQSNEVLSETKELTADMVSKGLRTLGIHPLTQKHTLLELFLPQLQLSSIDILKNYPLVVYLDISDNKLTSLNPLENMTALIHLKARNNQITDCLQYHPLLCNEKHSWAEGHNAVGSMLTLVDLSENQIAKLQDISHHPFLECLLLSKNQIQKIEGLRGLSFLQTLDLSYNQIAKIENLQDLPTREFNLSFNRVTSLEGIGSLKHLTSLNISNNFIFSLQPLQACLNLTYLDIGFNSIQFIRQVEYLTEIPWLQVLVLKGNAAAQKAHYRLRVLYRLPNLQRLDDINVASEEKIRANNLYKSSGGDLNLRRLVHEQVSSVPFMDFTPQQLEEDEENALSYEQLNQSPY